jgi:hypothetical protein
MLFALFVDGNKKNNILGDGRSYTWERETPAIGQTRPSGTSGRRPFGSEESAGLRVGADIEKYGIWYCAAFGGKIPIR